MRSSKRAPRRRRHWEISSTSAPSTMPSWKWAPCPSRCCSRESIVLSRMAAKAPILIWNKDSREHREKSLARRHRSGGVDLHRAMVGARARPATDFKGARKARLSDFAVGFVTNFFDTLGIGCFAPTTAYYKLTSRMPDDEIPGTLNTGHALPAMTEALIFIAIVSVDMTTLVSMIAAAGLGAWLGVGIVSGLSRRAIQLGMGVAQSCGALIFLAKNLHWMEGNGDALELHGFLLFTAVAGNLLLGALLMLGIGLYAPCLIMVSLLGMSPIAAFPIMMGSCALLMPVGGARFIRSGRYNVSAALGLAIGGIPGVLLAAYIVWSLPIDKLRWLVLIVVLYAGAQMLRSAYMERAAQRASPS